MPIILATQEAEIKPAWTNSLVDPILKKKIHHKKGWWNGSRGRA
jgi:hypothetical protein